MILLVLTCSHCAATDLPCGHTPADHVWVRLARRSPCETKSGRLTSVAFFSTPSLEKYGKVSKTVGRAKKSMLHPHATAADRETERRKAQEQEDAKRKAASEADAPVDSKKSLADFKRDLLYGRKTSGAAQGLQKLAQKASGKDDGEKAPDAGSAAAANASTPKPASAPSTGTERPQTDEGKTDA